MQASAWKTFLQTCRQLGRWELALRLPTSLDKHHEGDAKNDILSALQDRDCCVELFGVLKDQGRWMESVQLCNAFSLYLHQRPQRVVEHNARQGDGKKGNAESAKDENERISHQRRAASPSSNNAEAQPDLRHHALIAVDTCAAQALLGAPCTSLFDHPQHHSHIWWHALAIAQRILQSLNSLAVTDPKLLSKVCRELCATNPVSTQSKESSEARTVSLVGNDADSASTPAKVHHVGHGDASPHHVMLSPLIIAKTLKAVTERATSTQNLHSPSSSLLNKKLEQWASSRVARIRSLQNHPQPFAIPKLTMEKNWELTRLLRNNSIDPLEKWKTALETLSKMIPDPLTFVVAQCVPNTALHSSLALPPSTFHIVMRICAQAGRSEEIHRILNYMQSKEGNVVCDSITPTIVGEASLELNSCELARRALLLTPAEQVAGNSSYETALGSKPGCIYAALRQLYRNKEPHSVLQWWERFERSYDDEIVQRWKTHFKTQSLLSAAVCRCSRHTKDSQVRTTQWKSALSRLTVAAVAANRSEGEALRTALRSLRAGNFWEEAEALYARAEHQRRVPGDAMASCEEVLRTFSPLRCEQQASLRNAPRDRTLPHS